MRTFASRAVFSPPYTPPEKMIGIFCACGRKLCETFWPPDYAAYNLIIINFERRAFTWQTIFWH